MSEYQANIKYKDGVNEGREGVTSLIITIPARSNESTKHIPQSSLHTFIEDSLKLGCQILASLTTYADHKGREHILVISPKDRRKTMTIHDGTNNIALMVSCFITGFCYGRKIIIEDVCNSIGVSFEE